jgi:Arc/MetJ-type ribon-helix-helix transcriptional regulator
MSKSKLGKSADDIFAPKSIKETIVTTATKGEIVNPEDVKRARGRPQEHKETWSKITVVLLDKQIHWLDQLASTIRLNTKAAVSRAELIRAAIAAIEESEMDISHLNSEENIKNFLLEKLKK